MGPYSRPTPTPQEYQEYLGCQEYDYLGKTDETGLRFRLLNVRPGQKASFSSKDHESALLLLEGKGTLSFAGKSFSVQRSHWKEQGPWAFHFPAGERMEWESATLSRWAFIQTANSAYFPPRLYSPEDVQTEHRGKDILEGTCYRQVRLVFDGTIAPPPAKLVLGEVLNLPGRWSSYPPHHHPQPEIYYYEFDPVHGGYGHGELGDEVFKVKHQDLLKITESKDHSQVAAPGFTMYYLWAIVHLAEAPYRGFEFTRPYDELLKGI